jgi:hypothetical protein
LVQRGPRRMVWHHLHRAVFESEWISHCENVGVMPNARVLLQRLIKGCRQRAQRARAARLDAAVSSNARLDRMLHVSRQHASTLLAGKHRRLRGSIAQDRGQRS